MKEQMNVFLYSERRRGDQGGHSPQPAALLTIKKSSDTSYTAHITMKLFRGCCFDKPIALETLKVTFMSSQLDEEKIHMFD